MRLFIYSILLTAISVQLQAQDAVFTNFDTQLPLLNPAYIGDIPDDYSMRFNVQTRHQWWDVLSEYYEHTAISLEYAEPICLRTSKMSFAPALFIQQERFLRNSKPSLSTTAAMLGGALRIQIEEQVYLAAGFEWGVLQRRLDALESLQFSTQYDGLGGFDSNANSLESTISTQENLKAFASDLGLGIGLVWQNKAGYAMRTGLSIKHLQSPNLSLLQNEYDDDARIAQRLTAHYRFKMPIGNSKTGRGNYKEIQLYAMFTKQGSGIWQLNQGMEVGYHVQDSYIAIGGGLRLHTSPVTGAKLLSDVYGTIRFYKGNMVLYFSTDIANSTFAGLGDVGATLEVGGSFLFWNTKSKCGVYCPRF